jgi:asparagine N-glycosylation enzyme membrane subunit Stt3
MAEKIYSINYLILRATPLTNRMGVYVGINKQYAEVVYIGKSKDYWKRIPNSLEEKIKSKQNENCKDYGCELISFIPCNTVEEMDKLEIDLITYWKPYYNQQHNSDYYMNNDNKRLREILRKEFGRNLYTYEILFSHHALKNYYSGWGNVFSLAKEYIKSSSTIGNTKKNKEQTEKEINSVARKLKNIIRIHYDYFKHFCERTEEEKERLKKSLPINPF